MAARRDQADDLDVAWLRMVTLFIAKRDAMFEALGRHGLTPPHGHALTLLALGPVRMKDMADEMTCDASYITAVVDRLEELGLAERRPSAVDRRVKEVALTKQGEAVAAEITGTMRTPPAEFAALDAAQRRTLARLMASVVTELHPLTDPFRPLTRR